MAKSNKTITAIVTKSNDVGIQLSGQGDLWWNYSQFREGEIEAVKVGDEVTAAVDAKRFVYALSVVTPAPTTSDSTDGETSSERGKLIIRQTCVKAATNYAAAHPRMTPRHLLLLAQEMELWITRGADEFIDGEDILDMDWLTTGELQEPENAEAAPEVHTNGIVSYDCHLCGQPIEPDQVLGKRDGKPFTGMELIHETREQAGVILCGKDYAEWVKLPVDARVALLKQPPRHPVGTMSTQEIRDLPF